MVRKRRRFVNFNMKVKFSPVQMKYHDRICENAFFNLVINKGCIVSSVSQQLYPLGKNSWSPRASTNALENTKSPMPPGYET
jgi:hypothetical protein